jgi:hypothetical protein
MSSPAAGNVIVQSSPAGSLCRRMGPGGRLCLDLSVRPSMCVSAPDPLLVRTFSEGTGVGNLGRSSGLDNHAGLSN